MTEPTPAKRSWFYLDKETRWQVGGTAAVGLLIFGGIWLSDVLKKDHVPDGTDAGVFCQDSVKARLKSPASADFSDVRHSGTSPLWTITGSVDAENSFGANLRSDFTCKVRLDGGTFVLESLTGLR